MASSIKKTLLGVVQEILTYMDSDNVNTLTDTDEAMDVAKIVESVYFDFVSSRKIPEIRELSKLDVISDTTRPTYLKIPDKVKMVERLDYNVSTDSTKLDYRTLKWCDPDDFLNRMMLNNNDSTRTNMLDINGNVTLIIRNNSMPTYYTSFDDSHIVCDSYDSNEESTLTQNRTRALVVKIPTFEITDTFIPDLDDSLFRMLVNEAKSTSIAVLQKTVNPKVESQARKQRMLTQNDKYRIGSQANNKGFGRT